ncbi:MAG: hypothetical protein WC761_00410 [Candidatus Paceibacterota bacterium]|jgi:hypothetical protein
MTKTTTWVSRDNLHQTFLKTLENLEKKHQDIDNILTEDLYPLNKDTYHFVVKLLKPKDRLERALCSHIFNMAYQAEIVSQGAGVGTFLFVIGFAKYLLRSDFMSQYNEQKLVEDYQLRSRMIKTMMESLSRVASIEDIRLGINQTCPNNPTLQNVAMQAVSTAGLEGKIFIENGSQPNYVIETKDGYSFNAKPFKYFLGSTGTWERQSCKVLIIDGLIEKVSEIDHLLQKTHDTKQPLIIIAQGFSEEVVATLKVNQQRGNFEALPIRIMPDIESLNMVNDIAVVCGTMPVSSLKGDLLCFIKYEDLPTVESIRCNQKEITIQNSSTRAAVSSHIRNLLEKKNENSVIEDIQTLIDKRLKSLVSNAVVIQLQDMPPIAIDSTRVQLDNAFRISKTIMNYGMLDIETFLKKWVPETPIDMAIQAGLELMLKNKKVLPALSAVTTLYIAGKSTLMLLASNGMVYFT